ncbi:MAG: GNAT family protein [Anaerolineaceae bacterium]
MVRLAKRPDFCRKDAFWMLLYGKLVTLRTVETSDTDAILAVLQDPTVSRWWGHYYHDKVRAEMIEDDGACVFAIEADGAFAGIIQYGEELDPMYKHASIDLALAEGHQGRGIGPDAIRTLARYLFEAKGHHRLVIDPAETNRNAIRAYEGVGFQRVGVMREYECGADGAWHNGLLMDLLVGELTV